MAVTPGIKFKPSGEEIVMHYLRPHAMNKRLPSRSIIVDVDVLAHNPWELLPEGSEEIYYFSQRVRRGAQGKRYKRAAGDGFWKAAGKESPILNYGLNGRVPLIMGMKRTLVFYRGKAPAGQNTEWAMQEYRLAEAGLMPCPVMRPRGGSNLEKCGCVAAVIAKKNDELSQTLRNTIARLNRDPVMVNPDESWVVCRIYKKKKRMPRVITQGYHIAGRGRVPFFNFISQGGPERTASSSSVTRPNGRSGTNKNV